MSGAFTVVGNATNSIMRAVGFSSFGAAGRRIYNSASLMSARLGHNAIRLTPTSNHDVGPLSDHILKTVPVYSSLSIIRYLVPLGTNISASGTNVLLDGEVFKR